MNQKGFVKLVLIGVILVVLAIVGYFVLVKNNSTKNQFQSENTNWETYTNTKYDFEIKAPKDWINPNGLRGFSISEIPIPTEDGVSVKNLKEEMINGVKFTSYVSIEGCDMYSYTTIHNSLTYRFVTCDQDQVPILKQILSTFKFTEPKTQTNGVFVTPDGKKTLSIGSEVNLQWNIPKKSTDERYSLGIYLLNEKGEKVSATSILDWNYAKNGETYSNWKVGYLPSYGDGSGGDKIAVPGKYKLLLDYEWLSRNDSNHYLVTSNTFEIK